jgi:hypothetical protein
MYFIFSKKTIFVDHIDTAIISFLLSVGLGSLLRKYLSEEEKTFRLIKSLKKKVTPYEKKRYFNHLKKAVKIQKIYRFALNVRGG